MRRFLSECLTDLLRFGMVTGYLALGLFGLVLASRILVATPFILLSGLAIYEFVLEKPARWLRVVNHIFASAIVSFAIFLHIELQIRMQTTDTIGFAALPAIVMSLFSAGPLCYLAYSQLYPRFEARYGGA